MVAPIVGVAAASAVGTGGGIALNELAGSGGKTKNIKKNLDQDTQITRSTTTSTTDNRQYTYSPQDSTKVNYNPQVQIDSPDASLGSKNSQKSKKKSNPTQSNPVTIPVRQDPGQRSGQVGGGNQSGSSSGGDKMVLLGALGLGAAYLLGDF